MKEDSAPHSTRPNALADFGRVAGELVHDLANEMQVLQGWATLARVEAEHGQVPVEETERVSRISESLARMLQDVLSTIAGQSISPEVTFDPRALAEATLNDRLNEMSLGEVEFRSHLPEEVRISGRASFYCRVIVNLLRNATRHARSHIAVSLELDRTPEGREVVLLRVEDDGPGIPVENQDLIFQPLFRGDHGGAGLGLSSVAWSVDQLNGEVRYGGTSPLGGATFEVRLPTTRPILTKPGGSNSDGLKGLRIVLIDDDSALRFSISSLLRGAGAEVREIDPSTHPQEKMLEEVMSVLPDGILVDLHMRERGGICLWKKMWESVPQLAQRVLFISRSEGTGALWDDARHTGQPILAKPFDLQQLIHTLDEFRQLP